MRNYLGEYVIREWDDTREVVKVWRFVDKNGKRVVGLEYQQHAVLRHVISESLFWDMVVRKV